MFRGASFHRIDADRRISIPARFLDTIKASKENAIIMTIDNWSINCFTVEEWKNLKAEILAKKDKSECKLFNKTFLENSHKCFISKRGRVTIPHSLINLKGIKRDIVITGLISYFEIISKESWERESLRLKPVLDEAAKIGILTDLKT
jgi:division/cell wall cluster transcriptional repressor MraZ